MAIPKGNEPVLKLPHPYLTPYFLVKSSGQPETTSTPFLQIQSKTADNGKPLPEPLHNESLFFTEPADLKSSERPSESNNTPWGRARRAPSSIFSWHGSTTAPTLGQAWLLVYVLFTIRPQMEIFRLSLSGPGKDSLATQLKAVLLAIDHPAAATAPSEKADELVVLRSTFWQGAGSPFGPQTAWIPEDSSTSSYNLPKPLSAYPLAPYDNVMTNEPPSIPTFHPRRPAKPRPGSTIYSRWIRHLGENFSMVALDFEDAEHVALFHAWQNDPRVSQGWNLTGTLDQHREYLARLHADPHRFAVLAKFDDVFFAYFEIYWAKEDHLGAYYTPGDFDRGRHSLVGDVRFRGPHRVSAWWSGLMHYLFVDDPRTMYVVGEPKHTNSSVLLYDLVHGFGLDKIVDLPSKRSAFMRCSRERFFQLSPLGENDRVVGGTLVGLMPKL